MATITENLHVNRAQAFAPKEEGWSETIKMTFDGEIDGMVTDKETGVKKQEKVNYISVFVSEIIKAMCESDANLSAFLSAKKHDEKVTLVAMMLADADITIESTFVEEEQKYIRTITNIVVPPAMMTRVNNALDKLFGF